MDSDADPTTGQSNIVSLAIGETNLTVDAGLVSENPIAVDDTAKTCADELVSVNVLDNDTDDQPLSVVSISDADETAGVGGTITLEGGATATLNADGSVTVDGIAAYADLLIGEQATDSFSYTVEDGLGGSATADVDVTFCGAKNTLETIAETLPDTVQFTVPFPVLADGFDESFTLFLQDVSPANPALPLGIYEQAYCIDSLQDFDFDTATNATISIANEANAIAAGLPSGGTATGAEGEFGGGAANIDLVNWIINQDFGSQDSGDGGGDTFTDLEIQEAIWLLINGDTFFIGRDPAVVGPDEASLQNAEEIANLAIDNGEGFEAGEGDLVGLILDPTDPLDQDQPFIIGVQFDALAQDCFCL